LELNFKLRLLSKFIIIDTGSAENGNIRNIKKNILNTKSLNETTIFNFKINFIKIIVRSIKKKEIYSSFYTFYFIT